MEISTSRTSQCALCPPPLCVRSIELEADSCRQRPLRWQEVQVIHRAAVLDGSHDVGHQRSALLSCLPLPRAFTCFVPGKLFKLQNFTAPAFHHNPPDPQTPTTTIPHCLLNAHSWLAMSQAQLTPLACPHLPTHVCFAPPFPTPFSHTSPLHPQGGCVSVGQQPSTVGIELMVLGQCWCCCTTLRPIFRVHILICT